MTALPVFVVVVVIVIPGATSLAGAGTVWVTACVGVTGTAGFGTTDAAGTGDAVAAGHLVNLPETSWHLLCLAKLGELRASERTRAVISIFMRFLLGLKYCPVKVKSQMK